MSILENRIQRTLLGSLKLLNNEGGFPGMLDIIDYMH
jgi:hypothetical protein